MKWKAIAASVAALGILSGTASALTITNEDETGHRLEVILGEGDADLQTFQLPAGQSLADICEEGCTIKLPNGAEQSFEGDEDVTIKDGGFVIAD